MASACVCLIWPRAAAIISGLNWSLRARQAKGDSESVGAGLEKRVGQCQERHQASIIPRQRWTALHQMDLMYVNVRGIRRSFRGVQSGL